MRPNLFSFATSELSQDAFLCWLLAWADAKCGADNTVLHQVARSLLDTIYAKFGAPPPDQYTKVEIRKQEAGIDILCIVNERDAILIEDKVGTKQHSDQLRRYITHVSSKLDFADIGIFPIYVQTGDQSDYHQVQQAGYQTLHRHDLLAILESPEAQAASQQSDILADFAHHLRLIEDEVQSFLSLPLDQWSWNAWKGFYTRLQQERQDGHWDYVANPSGGFLGYYWHFLGDAECKPYLQLEQTKFCFKIEVQDEPKRALLRSMWHDKIALESPNHDLRVKRPDRFGHGTWMTVAVLDSEYRKVNAQGLLDLEGTVALMRKAECLLAACVSSA
jgi:hypothetical protein